MDKEKLNKLNDYYKANKSKCLALKNWIEIKNKNFKLVQALECIYDYANGKYSIITDIIEHLVNYTKTQGRTQVYADDINKKPHIDIIGQGDNLELINYNSTEELNKKGQKVERNPQIFRQKDGQVNKHYQNTEERLKNIGAIVRQLFPDVQTSTITFIIQAVRNYSKEKKISYQKVLKKLESNELVFDTRLNILRPSSNENKIIVISESVFNQLKESSEMEMTEYKFMSNIKNFLSELLSDPINAQPSFLLISNGFNRSKLIQLLLHNNIIIKDEKICDKDENNQPKTATMKVKYKVPKKDFKHKLKKLYIKNFEKNTPTSNNGNMKLDEDGEGAMSCGATSADSSGAFEQPVFGVQRRKIYGGVTETDTNSVGNYEYDVPFIGDKETLSRKNGIGGSVSINKI